MFKQYSLLLVLMFFCSLVKGQTITGRVSNAVGQPLANVSVSLLKDSNFITGDITDNNGKFQLRNQFISGTKYVLQLSLVGYENTIQPFSFPDTTLLGNLQMKNTQKLLGGVEVIAKKPLVSRKADRYIVNVEDSYLASGRTGLEVLQHSPGLWVNPQGDIRIIGGQSVTVMINDVVQRMSSGDLANFLRSLRSEDISRIEVIPNPPAEYEAASTGGIVHIILKKARKDGLTGTANAFNRIQGTRGNSGMGISIDYKIKRLYITGGINGSIDRSVYTGYTDVTYPDKTSLYNFTHRENDIRRYLFRAGIVYDFSPLHSLSLQAMTTASRLTNFFKSDLRYGLITKDVTGFSLSEWRRKPAQGSYTLNYNWKTDSVGSGIKLIYDYTYSLKTELNEVHSNYSDSSFDQTYHTITPSNTYINSGQVDYTQVLNKQSNIKAGIKYVHTGRDNDVLTERLKKQEWEKDPAASNEFRYTEKLLMFYGAYERTFGKTSLKTGLRGEQTLAEGLSITIGETIRRRYFGWFPSFFISHVFNEEKGSAINFNYARRVRRPGYNDLNPYRLQVHDFTILTGNPNLVPQYAHSFRGAYVFSKNWSAGSYLQTVKNYIAQTATRIDSNIIEYRSKNFPNSTEYGVFAEGIITIAKIWNSRNSAYFYRLSNNIDGGKYQRNSFAFQTTQLITLKKIMEIDIQSQYTSGSLNANARTAYIIWTDIGLNRKLFKDRGRLRFSISDIFNTMREKDLTEFNQTSINFYQKRPTRTFSLSFNYTFRAGKTFTKKRMESTDSDEKSRL